MIDQYLEWDAAYVLGALSSSERREFEDHLRDCVQCAAAVAELAAMPGLLRQLDVNDFVQPRALETDSEVPVSLLPRLALSTKRHRVRRRMVFGSAISVAAAAAVVAIVLLVLPLTGIPTFGSPTVQLSAVQPTNLTAHVTFTDQKWGTRLDTTCTYMGGVYSSGQSATYSMWVTSVDGTSSEVASWVAKSGSTVNPIATTGLDENQIKSVDIRSASGQVLLRGSVKTGAS